MDGWEWRMREAVRACRKNPHVTLDAHMGVDDASAALAELDKARQCAEESAGIMRRARERADRAEAERDEALEVRGTTLGLLAGAQKRHEKAEAALAEAPHTPDCEWDTEFRKRCNCWKSRAPGRLAEEVKRLTQERELSAERARLRVEAERKMCEAENRAIRAEAARHTFAEAALGEAGVTLEALLAKTERERDEARAALSRLKGDFEASEEGWTAQQERADRLERERDEAREVVRTRALCEHDAPKGSVAGMRGPHQADCARCRVLEAHDAVGRGET